MDPLYPALSRPTAPLPRRGIVRFVARCGVLFLPAAILALGANHTHDESRMLFCLGAALLAFLGLILLPQPRLAKPATGLAVIAVYILGLVWLWYSNSAYHQHWYPHLAVGVL